MENLRIRKELSRRAARKDLKAFCSYVMPEYQFNWHHLRLIAILNHIVENPRQDHRLIISMPPRHGKTQLASKIFPAYLLGRLPDTRILACSYTANLAHDINREIQRIMLDQDYQALFPASRLFSRDVVTTMHPKRNRDEFDLIDQRGKYSAAGVNGAITGKGADLLIIDDPIKNHQEAQSKVYRDRTWSWFRTDAYSRLEKGADIILIMTRWHEDDLAGRLLNDSSESWSHIKFPAMAEDHHPLIMANGERWDPREPGDALWPDKYDEDALAIIKDNMGSRFWASLYQQSPTVQDGDIFKREWFRHYDQYPMTTTNFYLDTAYTEDRENDRTAIIAFGRAENKMYIRHCEAVRLEFPDLIRWIEQYTRMHGYTNSSRIYIEPKASGLSVVQQLKSQTTLNVISDKPPKDAKETRAMMITAHIEAGRVLMPEHGAWVEDLKNELCGFPSMKHDDKVDALVGAVNVTFRRKAIRMSGRNYG